MRHVVVAEDLLFHAALAHALDHRGVVELVGEDHAVGQQPRDGRDRRLVGNEPRGEHQRRFLAMEVGERPLELDQRPVGARDIARAAGADAELAGRLLHRGDHFGMLAHAEIVVRAPDGDLARIVGRVAKTPRETARNALEIGKHAVALLLPQRIDRVFEYAAIVHVVPMPPADWTHAAPARLDTDQFAASARPLSP